MGISVINYSHWVSNEEADALRRKFLSMNLETPKISIIANENKPKNLIELKNDGRIQISTNLIQAPVKQNPPEPTIKTYVQVPKEPKFVRRVFGHALSYIGIQLKPAYELLPRPNEDVMCAFHRHGFSDADTAGLIQKLKDAGIEMDDTTLIDIANEIPLYTKKVDDELLLLKANQENFPDLEDPKRKPLAIA